MYLDHHILNEAHYRIEDIAFHRESDIKETSFPPQDTTLLFSFSIPTH